MKYVIMRVDNPIDEVIMLVTSLVKVSNSFKGINKKLKTEVLKLNADNVSIKTVLDIYLKIIVKEYNSMTEYTDIVLKDKNN